MKERRKGNGSAWCKADTYTETETEDKAACLVIGIERGETSLKNPVPTTVFEEGDIVWVVGEHEKIVHLSDGEVLQFNEE